MDCCGTCANEATSAFGGHRVRARGCAEGARIVSEHGPAEGDPTPCWVHDLRSTCRDVPSKCSSDCRTEGAWQQVPGFDLLRGSKKGLCLWDHAFPLPPWLSQRDPLLCPMHACRLSDA